MIPPHDPDLSGDGEVPRPEPLLQLDRGPGAEVARPVALGRAGVGEEVALLDGVHLGSRLQSLPQHGHH